MSTTIRQATIDDTFLLTALIRSSFRDVAERFSLTVANCPTHPSNCAPEWIEAAFQKDIRYYILEDKSIACGCVALEQARPGVCYLERLAILPQFRQRGFGQALVNHIIAEAKKLDIGRVEIGIIAEHLELKDWYQRQGFVTENTTHFQHLPFEVTFMFREI
jgi:N-acetylglutamate synthase-like GNAT family acetyltransferase